MAGLINHRVRRRLSASWIGVAGLVIGVGCQDRPVRVPAPSWDPEVISRSAVEELDINRDSAIDPAEVREAPGLAASFQRIDSNKDDRLTQEEVEKLIKFYEKMGTGLISQSFQISLDGRPATNARVEFVPEEFLGEVIKPAGGETDRSGVVVPQTIGQDAPAMQVGFYRVDLYMAPDAKRLQTRNRIGVEVSPVSTENESGTPVLEFHSE